MNERRNGPTASRVALVDALRAAVATMIAWHHFAVYGPLSLSASTSDRWIGWLVDWLIDFDKVVPIFFVVGGYIAARGLSSRAWNCRQVGRFIVHRYCRLGLPYLAAIALAVTACALARGRVPEEVIGPPPTWDQVLAHAVLLQDALGYESLSAGLWFVAIDYQLGLVYVAMLYLRDVVAGAMGRVDTQRVTWLPLALGWVLAAAALFVFNVDESLDVWAIFFFGHFFMGVLVHHTLQNSRSASMLALYVAMVVASLAYDFRWRVVVSLATGLVLYFGGKLGLMERWPASRIVARLGLTSYSLFLVHFPVVVLVSTVWVQLGDSSASTAVIATIVAYTVSLIAAEAFYRAIETPSARLSRKFS
jgi:peptidoglycan/LPS O-acetylase OafA/YrhL